MMSGGGDEDRANAQARPSLSPPHRLATPDDLHRYYARRLAEHQRRRRPGDRSLLGRLVPTAIRLRIRAIRPGSRLDNALGRLRRAIARGSDHPLLGPDPDYEIYLASSEPRARELHRQARQARRAPAPLVLHLFDLESRPRPGAWEMTARSLLRQTYPHWTWTSSAGSAAAGGSPPNDDRLRREPNPEAVYRLLAENSSGRPEAFDWIGFLSCGEHAAPQALFHIANSAADGPDLIYADVDWIDDTGVRHDPLFKPDWSPATNLSTDLLSGLLLARRAVVRTALADGRPASGRQFHLRLAEAAERIAHVPGILTHRPGDEQAAWAWLDSADAEGAVRQHLARRGIPNAQVGIGLGGYPRATWDVPSPPPVSIVIPSRDQVEVLEPCLQSLAGRTAHPVAEVIIVDTGSKDPRAEALYRSSPLGARLRLERQPGDFNFARACNAGARRAAGDLILFLNNDTEALDDDWLARMAQWHVFPEVGIVGAKLLYPDETIQHAGVVVGMGGMASHLFQGLPELEAGIFGSDQWYRDLSAVTAACMLVSRRAFESLGGFDEAFRVNYQDVDFCLRARRAGWGVIYTPDARLLHHEALSHRRRIPRRDFELATERWLARGDLDGDPYFNPHVSFMSATPTFTRGPHDSPRALNRRLMNRLPRKEIIALPEDLW